MRKSAFLFLPFLFMACVQDRTGIDATNGIEAFVPVYVRADTLSEITIKTEAPIATVKPGKIYAYGNYIFQNEINRGIHIIQNGSQPKKIGFISIPFNTEMAVRGNHIYANSINNLIVINMSDPFSPVLEKTLKNAFPLINQKYPPSSGSFVCADESKGIVVDWQLQTVQTAACRR